jgi:hypothetical protein
VSWLLISLTVPVTSPVKSPSNVPATNVSDSTVHLSVPSFHTRVLFANVPLSISIPAFWLGVPVSLLLSTMRLSSTVKVSVFKIVCVPFTVRLPLNIALSLNVLAPAMVWAPDVQTTVLSTAIAPEVTSIPSSPLK